MIIRKMKIDIGKRTEEIRTEEIGGVMIKKIEKGVGVEVIKKTDIYKYLSSLLFRCSSISLIILYY